ncbi:hypothetical protein DN748_09290 [Sinomicrobium soli]|nr:hypothetical protein DN748_09290 [Sinomicrobium sp. N-1-3-6]
MLGVTARLSAQGDIPIKSVPIPAEKKSLPKSNSAGEGGSILNTPDIMESPMLNPYRKNTKYTLDPSEDQSNFMQKEQFLNPGEKYNSKINRQFTGTEGEDRNGNYTTTGYLGDFKTNSKTVGLACRDHEYVDGDRVRIYLNDSVVVYDVTLEAGFKVFHIPLQKGFNKIEFQALNQGSSGPNTAELRVFGDQGELLSANEWLLNTGGKATMIVVKDEEE